MKTRITFCLFLLVFPVLTWSQNCYDYSCVIRKVQTALAAKQYQSAFDNLESAAAYPDSRPEEIAGLREQLFRSIQREKEQAESERQRAEQAENQVRNTLKTVQEERDRSDALRKAAEKNSEINRLAAQAIEIQREDPGLAARLAHYAFQLSDRQHPLAAKIRRNIYEDPTALLLNAALVGHRESVTALAFSPDGQYIVTGSRDQTAILWDLNGRILHHFVGHTANVTQVAFTPDGRYLVTGSADNTLKLWNLQGAIQRTFSGHSGTISHIAFSSDGKRLLSVARDGLRLWEMDGRLLAEGFESNNSSLEAISFMEENRKIVGVNTYGTVSIWDLEGKLLNETDMEIDNLLIAAFSPDGARLLVNSIGRKTLLWQTSDNSLERVLPDHSMFRIAGFSAVDGHILIARTEGEVEAWELSGRQQGPSLSLGSRYSLTKGAFSPDGQWLVALGSGGPPKLWRLSRGDHLRLGGHQDEINAMITAPDGSQIITGSNRGEIIAWSADGEKRWMANCYAGGVKSLAMDPGGARFAVGSEGGQIEIRTDRGVLLQTIQGPAYRMGEIWALAFSPDGRQLFLAGYGTHVEAVDLATGNRRIFRRTESDVYSIAFSPDGEEILLGGMDGITRRYDLQSNLLMEYRGDSDRTTNRVLFSPDGRQVLSAKGATVYIWDLEGQLIDTLAGHKSDIVDLAISPDGQYLLTGSYDQTANLWSSDGQLMKTLEGFGETLNAVGFLQPCPDCELQILATEADQLAVIRKLDGALQTILGGHEAEVRTVAFHPRGELMATAGRDGQILLWDQQGHLLQRIYAHERDIRSIDFSPDGKWLLSGSLDQYIKLWDHSGRMVRTFSDVGYGVSVVRFFPDGQSLLTAAGSTLLRRDLAGNIQSTFEVPFNIIGLDISGDGKHLALSGGGGQLLLLRSDGELMADFQTNPNDTHYAVAFSPDGNSILVGSNEGKVSLFNWKGELIRAFSGMSASVYSVAFSPACNACDFEAGQLIAAGGEDGVMLWDRQGQEVQRFPTGNTAVTQLQFAPDGKSLLAGREDQTATRFDNLEVYFRENHGFLHGESRKYGVPFDYQTVDQPDLILDYGLTYLLQARQYDRWLESLEPISLRTLDTSLRVMNVLVNRFGDGYRFYKAEVLYNYARYHFRNTAFKEAISAYERVIAFNPANEWINLELGTTLLFDGRWEEAKAIYDQWLGKKWDPTVSGYARTWDEAFYKYLREAAKIVPPKDAALLKKAEQYLLEVMSQ